MTMHVCRCPGSPGHPTFGACMRAKNIKVGYCRSHLGWDASRQQGWDKELDLYRSARAQGVQPDGTHTDQVRMALDASDAIGAAYGAEPSG